MSDSSKNIALFLRRLWFASANLSDETLASKNRVRQIGLIYSTYRLLINILLIVSTYVLSKPEEYKRYELAFADSIKAFTVFGYLGIALLLLTVFYFWRHKLRRQLLIGFLVDMTALSLLLYSGAATGLQIVLLYMVVVAASFMLIRLSQAVIVTFTAILSLIYQQFYFALTNQSGFLSLADAVMLSLSLLSVGFLSWSVSQRLANAELSASSNAREIERLNTINQAVIRNMVNGVIVIGRTGRLVMINITAEHLLCLAIDSEITGVERLFEIERTLVKRYPNLSYWYQNDDSQPTFILNIAQNKENEGGALRFNKKFLPEHGRLLIIEDVSREYSHAQQLKLASLGQLTASIAHEVRNPLGAISQASQILIEDIEQMSDMNRELCEIIYFQTKRVNRIIEDVMRLSRQEPPKQEIIQLSSWLTDFLTQHYPNASIATRFDDDATLGFDPHHLEQIFINLLNNALRHTKRLPNQADIEILIHTQNDNIMIDVLDNGDGVSKKDLESLFNPFFTTSQGGTGLGLYLSLAFSEANHAKLIYVKDSPKTCFRLISPQYIVKDLLIYTD